MTQKLSDLVDRLTLEVLEENLFRGLSRDVGFPKLFGGQVLGQALAAAEQTVGNDRPPHSMHGYFLRPGDTSKPVIYQVERMRDGRSFSTRRVTAIQHGHAIFTCVASFQPPEAGVEHQVDMPTIPNPESLTEDEPVMTSSELILIESRRIPTDGNDSKRAHMWFRSAGKLPDNPDLHRKFLAYASDYRLLEASMHPHGLTLQNEALQLASLDHAIWFHSNARADEWLLYCTDSPWAGGARGLCRGSIFSSEGKLIATTSQEGLIRVRSRRTNSH